MSLSADVPRDFLKKIHAGILEEDLIELLNPPSDDDETNTSAVSELQVHLTTYKIHLHACSTRTYRL